MKRSDTGWLTGALVGISLVGVFVMLCGITLSLGFRTLSIISFFSVVVLLGAISVIRKVGSKPPEKD